MSLHPVHLGRVLLRHARPLPTLAESAWRAVALLELVIIVGIIVWWPR